MKKFLLFSILSLVACGVESGADTVEGTDDTASSVPTEVSRTTSNSTEAGPTTQAVSCSLVWDCELCSDGRPRNVLHELCSDGSDTVVLARPCGEECF
jgi:hypothetical protein